MSSFLSGETIGILDINANTFVKENCKPIMDILLSSKNMCYNKDSTTRNWMINQRGRLIVIDTEDRGVVPYALDVASFLNFTPSTTFDEMITSVNKYAHTINSICKKEKIPDKMIIDKKQFMIEYFNAVIYRAIISQPYLDDFIKIEGRPHIKDMLPLLEGGIKSIDYLRKNKWIIQTDDKHYEAIRNLFIHNIKKHEEELNRVSNYLSMFAKRDSKKHEEDEFCIDNDICGQINDLYRFAKSDSSSISRSSKKPSYSLLSKYSKKHNNGNNSNS